MKSSDYLVYASMYYKGEWEEIYKCLKEKRTFDQEEVKQAIENCRMNYITILDEEYPDCLKNVYNPPFVLYYKGDISLLSNANFKNRLSVVGSRKCSEYGMGKTLKFVSELNNDVIIVSGLAYGIDSVAHRAALNSKKKTIAVLPCGINNVYPNENSGLLNEIIENGGLVVSEYPLSVEPIEMSFLVRNRIIAALSKALFVGEAHIRSGTSVTVTHMLNLGRDIGCLPYHVDEDSGCNKLIKEGAALIESAKDLESLLER